MRLLKHLILVVALSTSSFASDFRAGIKAYEEGKYHEAIEGFETALTDSSDTYSAAAHHNLALSYLQFDQPAEAVWQLERAIRIEPYNDDYRFKLEILRENLGLTTSQEPWHQVFAGALSITQWATLASLAFWLLVLSIALPIANRRPSGLANKGLRFLSIIILICSLFAWAIQHQQNQGGIVICETSVTLHAAPATASPTTGTARPGERAKILDTHGAYFQIQTEGQATGWIPRSTFRPIL